MIVISTSTEHCWLEEIEIDCFAGGNTRDIRPTGIREQWCRKECHTWLRYCPSQGGVSAIHCPQQVLMMRWYILSVIWLSTDERQYQRLMSTVTESLIGSFSNFNVSILTIANIGNRISHRDSLPKCGEVMLPRKRSRFSTWETLSRHFRRLFTEKKLVGEDYPVLQIKFSSPVRYWPYHVKGEK